MPRTHRAAAVVSGKRAVTEALKAGRATRLLVARNAQITPGLRETIGAAESAGVPVERASREDLDRKAPGNRGVAAVVDLPAPLSERDLAKTRFPEDALVVVLDGIEDPQNLGAAARVADGAGAVALVTRARRAAGITPAAVRASAGALAVLRVAVVANIPRALKRLRDAGFTAVGLDERAPGSILDVPCPAGRLAMVVGAEGRGLSRLARASCDELVSVPMRGTVASLNASTALAAVCYGWILPRRARPNRSDGATA
jgi:23S rRNA (guanosine2251-2'-O)-methyltransferase